MVGAGIQVYIFYMNVNGEFLHYQFYCIAAYRTIDIERSEKKMESKKESERKYRANIPTHVRKKPTEKYFSLWWTCFFRLSKIKFIRFQSWFCV